MSGVSHQVEKGAQEIFSSYRLTSGDDFLTGAWLSQKIHARCNLDLLGYYFPQMDRQTQERAGRSMMNIKSQWSDL